MKKILICGNYGAKNIGDELILISSLKILKNFDVEVLSCHKKGKYGVNHYPKFPSGLRSFFRFIFSPKVSLKALKRADLFLLGGGNLFGGPSKKANIIWGIQGLFALIYKKPLIIFCQSVGTNLDIISKTIIKFIFSRSVKIFLRDEASVEILKKIGIKNEMKVLSDPALILEKKQNLDRTNVLVSLRYIDSINQNFINSIEAFLKTQRNISFINFETGKENDEILSKMISSKLKNINSETMSFEEDPLKVLNEFKKAKFAVCMRLHAVISAIITNTPFIAISYAKKVEAFLKYANLQDLMIKQKDISFNLLLEKYHYLNENKAEINQRMIEFKHKSKEKFENFDEKLSL